MSILEHSRFDELVSRYMDASLGEAEEHELLQYLSDESLAGRFHEITKLNAEIWGLLAGSMPNEVMVELVRSDLVGDEDPLSAFKENVIEETDVVPTIAHTRPKRSGHRLVALAALLMGLLVVTAFYVFHTKPPGISVQIADVRGEVYLDQAALHGDQPLKNGETIKTVGPDSRANLTLADGTQIRLMGDTTFSADLQPGKRRLNLEQGTLHANVAKQKEKDPLMFSTSNTLATVRGTGLVLIARPQDTYVVVLKGVVSVERSSGGSAILIETGHYCHMEEAGEYHSWPFQRLPQEIQDQALSDK